MEELCHFVANLNTLQADDRAIVILFMQDQDEFDATAHKWTQTCAKEY